jgi:hypothetical protein
MATVLQPFQNQADQQQQTGPALGQGSPTAAASQPGGVSSPGSPSTPTSGASPSSASAPTNSGQYTNLQKYFNANQNFNQGQGLSGQVAGTIGQEANQAQQNTQSASNTFQNQANSNFNNFAQNQGTVQQALANPNQFVQSNPNAVQQFQSVLNAQYGGPQSLSSLSGNQNYNVLQNQTQAAQQQAGLTQSQAGQMQLLQQMYGNPTYSQGQQSLDQLFMQSPQANQQFGQAQQQAAKASQGLQQAQQQATGMAQSYTQQANQMAQGAQQGLTAAGTNLQNSINTEVANANTQGQTAYQNLINQIGQNQPLSAGLANQLGLGGAGLAPGQAANGQPVYTYGANLGQYIAQNAPATAANAASANDYATFAALQQLQGNGTEVGNILNGANASQAGTYNPYSVNTAAMQNAISQGQNAYNQAIQPDQQKIANLQSELNGGTQSGNTKVTYSGFNPAALQQQIAQLQAQEQAMKNTV